MQHFANGGEIQISTKGRNMKETINIKNNIECVVFIGQKEQYPQKEQGEMRYQLKGTFYFIRVFSKPSKLRAFLMKYLVGLEFYEVEI